MTATPQRTKLAHLDISRLVCGLWQVADMEKGGRELDREKAATALAAYADAGFDTFDMADHYGSAELITGAMLKRMANAPRRPVAFTKWCPAPGPMTAEIVRAGVQDRLSRLGVAQVDLLQFHWWSFEHPAWLDALHELKRLKDEGLIGAIGVTNFDAAHLHLAVADGILLASNQVSFSLIDRRAAGPLSDVCARHGVKLLAYGTLCGGFLSERWLGQPEPQAITDWSQSKYKRFIDVAGGWDVAQKILGAADAIARKHGVSISNVASRWVLDHPAVAATIIGIRLGENVHRDANLKIFDVALDGEDHALLNQAFAAATPIPGDCGDEYRRPPFLTASGDLSHHLSDMPKAIVADTNPVTGRLRVSTGSRWEAIAGYCRAVRVKDQVYVSGTTATHGADRCVAPGDAAAQTTYTLDKIIAALAAAGARPEDVVRTRIYLRDIGRCLEASGAHGRVFGAIQPANTLIQAGALFSEGYEVEIEADAVIGT